MNIKGVAVDPVIVELRCGCDFEGVRRRIQS